MNLRVFYLTRRGISDGYGFSIQPAWNAYKIKKEIPPSAFESHHHNTKIPANAIPVGYCMAGILWFM